MFWMGGFAFTLGYTTCEKTTGFLAGMLTFCFWPLFLGHMLSHGAGVFCK